MPYLLSASGLQMSKRYVINWYSPVFVFLKIIPATTARFRNGKNIYLTRTNYSEFREEILRQYLEDNGFSYRVENGRTIVRTNSGLKLIIIPDYLNVIDEVFLRNRYCSARLSGRIVIDVGASIGDTSLYFASMGASKVYAFEADKSRYEVAEENIHLNGKDKIIKIMNDEANSENISELIENNHLSNIFLKLDCEGCEYEILPNISKATYEQIDDIAMEYHKDSDPLITKLREEGYNVKRDKRILIPEGHIFASKNEKFG
jgi:hypothetical protein